MAITPEQAKQLTPSEETMVKTMEQKIDEMLKYGDRCYQNLPANASKKVISKLIEIYQKIGWEVDYLQEKNALKFYEKSRND